MANPYDDDVIYTVTTSNGAEHTGKIVTRVVTPGAGEDFWMIDTGYDGEWIHVNPAHIVSLSPARGAAYSAANRRFGL